MFILVESRPETKETVTEPTSDVKIKGLYRQIRGGTIQAWKMFYKNRLENVADYCNKDVKNPIPVRYRILCWDDRENFLLGTWDLHSPPLERGNNKDPVKQEEKMKENIKKVLDELEGGSVPGFLWNQNMLFTSTEDSNA